MKAILLTSALALALAACSPSQNAAPNTSEEAATNGAVPEAPAAPPAASPATIAPSNVLGRLGLGDLKIGEPVPAKSKWAESGTGLSDGCQTLTSPLYPGVYAIAEGGKVRRITIGARSDVKLAEGIGVGSSEADVLRWFAGFRSEPHKYEPAPAKYLTVPNSANGDPGLRFEIGQDDKVRLIHVGTMPTLGYVEGCS